VDDPYGQKCRKKKIWDGLEECSTEKYDTPQRKKMRTKGFIGLGEAPERDFASGISGKKKTKFTGGKWEKKSRGQRLRGN